MERRCRRSVHAEPRARRGSRNGHRLREQPAVEDAGRDDADSALRAEGEQLVERRLLEECVTQDAIRWPAITRLQDV